VYSNSTTVGQPQTPAGFKPMSMVPASVSRQANDGSGISASNSFKPATVISNSISAASKAPSTPALPATPAVPIIPAIESERPGTSTEVIYTIPPKKKSKSEKKPKKYVRSAGGTAWEDPTLLDWDTSELK